jgi:hypothetical protein
VRKLAGWLFFTCACAPGKFDDLVRDDSASDIDAAVEHAGAHDATMPRDARMLDAAGEDARVDASSDASSGPRDSAVPGTDAGTDAGTACETSSTGILAVSKPLVELARMAKSAAFGMRSLGPIVRLGDTDHVWTFNTAARVSTLPQPAATPGNHPHIAFDGDVQPWNRPVTRPWTLKRSTAEDALPPTMLPLSASENAIISLVPLSFTRYAGEPRSELYVLQYDYLTPTKVWRATVEDNSEVAQRAAQPLFSAPPLFAIAARIDSDIVHVYACSSEGGPSLCYAGRVPYAKRDDPSAYQVRARDLNNQWTWSADLQSGTPVLEDVLLTDLTVSYNSYLRRFVATYGHYQTNHVILRTSANPYGPWSEPVRVPLPAPGVLLNLSVREHPSLAQQCERRLVISYFAPSAENQGFPTAGDIVMAAIDLD